jgi:hypothetical protein
MTDKKKPEPAPRADPARPRQPPYGQSENYGSPGGDEPPASTDPGSGHAGDARERHEAPATK